MDKELFPMVVQAVVDEGEGGPLFKSEIPIQQQHLLFFYLNFFFFLISTEHLGHSHILLATFEKVRNTTLYKRGQLKKVRSSRKASRATRTQQALI